MAANFRHKVDADVSAAPVVLAGPFGPGQNVFVLFSLNRIMLQESGAEPFIVGTLVSFVFSRSAIVGEKFVERQGHENAPENVRVVQP